MSEKQKTTHELISALMDDELSEHELARLLRDVESDDDARLTWARYQMVSTSIKGEMPIAPQWDISSGVSQAIAEEPAFDLTTGLAANDEKSTLRSGVVRFAVAASVTLAVIFGVTQNSSINDKLLMGGPQVAQNIADDLSLTNKLSLSVPQSLNQQPVGFNAPPIYTTTVSSGNGNRSVSRSPDGNRNLALTKSALSLKNQAAFERRLNQYMLKHAEHAALNSGRGMMPFARVTQEK